MSKQWCIDNLKVLKDNAGTVDAKVFEETIKYLEEDISYIEQMIIEIESYNSPLIGKNVVLDIIHKYTDKEQT